MSLELRVSVEGPAGTVEARGEIDVQTSSLLKQGVDRAVGRGVRVVLLDLARVTFIDSTGLAAILSRHKLLSGSGGRLVLLSPTAHVRRLLAVTHLDEVLAVRASRAEAEDLLGEGGQAAG